MISRRSALAGAGAMVVLGFNPSAHAWVTDRRRSERFHRVPRLDGTLVTDPASLAPYAQDAGFHVSEAPRAVLIPGSVRDIQKMVRFCAQRRIDVAARGQGHTTFGQSFAKGGLVIDMGPINAVHRIKNRAATVGAGLKWNQLVTHAVAQGLTPPALTGYLGLSIGGTLAVGGISSTIRAGAQIDHVQELEVVTGEGELVTCSPSEHSDLFDAVLGGLGQYGIVTRAKLDLTPAAALTRTYTIDYTDSAMFFADLRELLRRGELDEVYNFGLPSPAGGFIYQLTTAKHYDPKTPPNDAFLFRGLAAPSSAVVALDSTYLEFVLRVDVVIDFFRQIGLWDGVQHPWFDAFLSDRTVEPYVSDVTASLTPEDVGPTGFLLLFPKRRSLLTRPMLRVPDADKWVFLYDILTAAAAPGEDPPFVDQMLIRNRALLDRAIALGGTRYPIGSVVFDRSDWKQHYGKQWHTALRAKHRFDPRGIMTPGPGIFC